MLIYFNKLKKIPKPLRSLNNKTVHYITEQELQRLRGCDFSGFNRSATAVRIQVLPSAPPFWVVHFVLRAVPLLVRKRDSSSSYDSTQTLKHPEEEKTVFSVYL